MIDIVARTVNRRDVLKGFALVGAASILPADLVHGQERAEITWWDIFQPLIPLNQKVWEKFAAENPADI